MFSLFRVGLIVYSLDLEYCRSPHVVAAVKESRRDRATVIYATT